MQQRMTLNSDRPAPTFHVLARIVGMYHYAAYVMLETEPRALCTKGKLHPGPWVTS